MFDQKNCPNCHTLRSSNLKEPCSNCGSRLYPFGGYQYEHEWKEKRLSIVIISIVLILAVLLGAFFLIWANIQLQ